MDLGPPCPRPFWLHGEHMAPGGRYPISGGCQWCHRRATVWVYHPYLVGLAPMWLGLGLGLRVP